MTPLLWPPCAGPEDLAEIRLTPIGKPEMRGALAPFGVTWRTA